MASIMTALWFGHIGGEDKVAVKPHASPVYHAIKYLTGELDRSYLTTLRQRGGLQAYPSRTKDPDVADFSTGSVGLGAVAPLFSALTRRYTDSHFGGRTAPARFIALVGDAELDEGNVWEAIADPATAGARQLHDGRRPQPPEPRPGDPRHRRDPPEAVLRRRRLARRRGQVRRPPERCVRRAGRRRARGDTSTRCRTRRTSSSSRSIRPTLRQQVPGRRRPRSCAISPTDSTTPNSSALVTDLGGHDLGLLLDTLTECDAEHRPAVGRVRLHDQGPRPADRRRPAEPCGAAEPRADRRAPDRGRPRPSTPSGTASTPTPRRAAAATPSVATSTTRRRHPGRPCRPAMRPVRRSPTARRRPRRRSGESSPASPTSRVSASGS